MALVTKQYLRKPLVVDALQVTAENFEEVAQWCQGLIVYNSNELAAEVINPHSQHINVRVHDPKTDRQTKAYVGDWILYNNRGYKIYTPKAFHASFDEVPNL